MQIALRTWDWPQHKTGISENVNLNTFPQFQPWGTWRRFWVDVPLPFLQGGESVCVCVGPTIFAKKGGGFMSNIMSFYDHQLLFFATAISFYWEFRTTGMHFVQKGEKVFSKLGERSDGSREKNPQKTRSSGFQDTIHITRWFLLLDSENLLPWLGKKRVQVASFQTLLIILKANTSRSKRWVAPSDKRIAPRATEQAASHTRLQAGEGENGRMTESRAGQNERLNGIG